MKLKINTILAGFALAATSVPASADTYFLAPESVGDGDGMSWESAMGVDDLKTIVESFEEGNTYCFLAGTYKATAMTIPQGAIIKGGFPASSTGTDTESATPFDTPTVWDADIDGDGNGDNLTNPLITIDAETLSPESKTTTVCGIKVVNAKYTGESRDGSVLHGHACKIVFRDCWFENCKNVTPGGVLYVNKADLTVEHSLWKDNYSEQNPVCLKSNTVKVGIVVLNGCTFSGNTCKTDWATSSDGKHGGMIGFKGQALYIVNCTSDGNGFELNNNGAFVRNDAGLPLFMAYNTIFNYHTVGTKNAYGQIASIAKDTPLYMMGNIIVNKDDLTANDSKFGCVYLQAGSGTDNVVDGGYNYIDGLFQSGKQYNLASTDVLNATTATVFGAATPDVQTKGGAAYVAPVADLRLINTADAASAAANWNVNGLPTLASLGIDLTKDILGQTRAATTYPGAYDQGATSGIVSIAAEDEVETDAPVVYYNLQGMRVSNPAQGSVYIRVQGSKTSKVRL